MSRSEKTELRIQRFAVENPETSTPTIEMTLANHEYIDEATQIVVASVKVQRDAASLESYQLAVLQELRKSLDDIIRELETRMDPDAAQSAQRTG